ncbi:MAG: 50S ribosomal protein L5 [Candidatus Niyogibacteria bacterium]|nr:MAG: 50S ribosomal protein L5 [Candidatus Niyogibacteria bacterium]
MNELKLKYGENIADILKKKLGFKNSLAAPRLIKIVINTGTGRKEEKDKEIIIRHFELISGQKCAPRGAKKSIAAFKTRQGVVVGFACTLRGARMYDFLDKLINVALPRIRDFRGIDLKSIDSSGNLTIGFKEHIVFPEIAGEDVKAPFGLEVTLVTNAKTRDEAEALFKAIGVPFKK